MLLEHFHREVNMLVNSWLLFSDRFATENGRHHFGHLTMLVWICLPQKSVVGISKAFYDIRLLESLGKIFL